MADNTTEYLLIAREAINEALIKIHKGDDVHDLIAKATDELDKAKKIQDSIHKA